MKKPHLIKLALALLLLGCAGILFARFLRRDDGVSEKTFFYDLSERKLFAAAREAIPPIRGINDAGEDAVRAIVIAPGGDEDHEGERKIVYLEKYAPGLKQHIEKVRAGQADPLPTRVQNSMRFVKRVEDAEWHAVNSPEGQQIMTEWQVAGPDGEFPAVCVP